MTSPAGAELDLWSGVDPRNDHRRDELDLDAQHAEAVSCREAAGETEGLTGSAWGISGLTTRCQTSPAVRVTRTS